MTQFERAITAIFPRSSYMHTISPAVSNWCLELNHAWPMCWLAKSSVLFWLQGRLSELTVSASSDSTCAQAGSAKLVDTSRINN